ncbi:MAG: hypothetical protein U0800_22165 [Isosphaeraceae bacterium]
MSDLDDAQIDRLESALASFAKRDGAARGRLLAALAADSPPSQPFARKSRMDLMKRYASASAIAATLLVVGLALWHGARPRPLFAQVAGAMSRVKGFRCDLVEILPRKDGAGRPEGAGEIRWNPSGEERVDLLLDGKPLSTIIFRPGENGLRLEHAAKQYRIVPRSAPREFSFGLFGGLGNFKGRAETIAGAKDIGGVKAEGFRVPWPKVVGDDTHANAKVEVWIDPATTLPVRVDLVGMGPVEGYVMRLENFRWAPQDPALFLANAPEGYAKQPATDLKTEEITRYVTEGLRTFAKYNNGRYPAVRYIYGDEQGAALRKLMGMPENVQGFVKPDKDLRWADPKQGEFAHGSYGFSWINTIQREFPDAAYHGKTVTPEDKDKVLLRWRLDDGDYRVIYGDLSAENVGEGRLRELEAR